MLLVPRSFPVLVPGGPATPCSQPTAAPGASLRDRASGLLFLLPRLCPPRILPLTAEEPQERGLWSRAAQRGEGRQCPRGRTLSPGSKGRALTAPASPHGWPRSSARRRKR